VRRVVLTSLALAALACSDAADERRVLRVRAGESIAAAIDRAEPGTTIEVEPGVYHEALVVDTHDITLRGLAGSDGSRPVLDGRGRLADGVIASGSPFTIVGFSIRRYQASGVSPQSVRGVTLADLHIEDPGIYGVYPVQAWDAEVRDCVISGASDAGIYVGSSNRVKIVGNEVQGNVVGIYIQNTNDAEVRGNHAHDNTIGVLIGVEPLRVQKSTSRTRLHANRVVSNNHPNFGDRETFVGQLPPGIGVLVLAADHTTIEGNQVRDNRTMGVGIIALPALKAALDPDLDPLPDGNRLGSNQLAGNGVNPQPPGGPLALPPGALVWDGHGTGNCVEVEVSTTPAELPACPATTP